MVAGVASHILEWRRLDGRRMFMQAGPAVNAAYGFRASEQARRGRVGRTYSPEERHA